MRRKKSENKNPYDGSKPLPDLKQEFFTELYTASFTVYYGHGQNSYCFAYGFQKRLDELNEALIGANNNTGRGKKRKKIGDADKIRREIKSIENTCKSNATRLLTNAFLLARVNWRLDQAAEDKIMDREAMRVVQQSHNLDAKMRAIERFDKVRGRIIEKVEQKLSFEGIEVVTIKKPAKV